MAKTFAELERDPAATADQLKTVLEEYVTSGTAINPSVVIDLVKRINPSREDRRKLLSSAERGYASQFARGETKAAAEYARVARHLDR